MYKCYVCRTPSSPKQQRILHTTYRVVTLPSYDGEERTRREVEREYPVCQMCKEELDSGTAVYELIQSIRPLGPTPIPLREMVARDRMKLLHKRS